MTSEEMVSRLLYRDGLMLVIDKPAGLAVHQGPPNSKDRSRECLQDHFDALRFGLPRPPSLGHRLDRDTSGCLVLGRHRKALAHIGKLFRNGAIDKTYWAVVEGSPETDEGTIELPLGRLDATRGWWMKVDAAGLPSQTRWTIAGRGEIDGRAIAWLELEPLTGRTHQLRVHCAAMGWPILGDNVYGSASREDSRPSAPGLQLLARRVSIPIAKARPPIVVEAPAPAHMLGALKVCGFAGDPPPAIVEREQATVASQPDHDDSETE